MAKILWIALFPTFIAAGATAPGGQSLGLAWTASADPEAVGCAIYYGTTSGIYIYRIDAGDATSANIYGLAVGVDYYFAVAAYDAAGNESNFSNEITVVLPATIPALQIRSAAAGQFTLTVAGLAGQTFQILATQDFTAWTAIGTVTLGTGGTLEFTDPDAPNYPQRFYRTRPTF